MKKSQIINKIVHLQSMGWCIIKETKEGIVYTPLDTDRAYTVKKETSNGRTVKQNNSIHKYCDEVSIALYEAGFTVQKLLRRKQEKKIKSAFEKLTNLLTTNVFGRIISFLGLLIGEKELQETINAKDEALRYVNEAMSEILENTDLEIDWTMELVKDIIWRNIQLAIYKDKKSTTQLKSNEVTVVYRTMDKYLTGIGLESIAFPSVETIMMDKWCKEN